ncbi:MAG TPA: GtrA family protein, partial [Verrucomicrobiae bacterium]|nr:GtrA family protein [Verrucomicrobiae bacterium]
IGLSGTVLDFSIFWLIGEAKLLNLQAANAVSYASGTMLSFILNTLFNFRVSDKIALRLICFFGVALLGWSVSAGLLHVLVETYGCNKYLSKAATLVVVVILQYNLNRRISFRKSN